MRKLIVSVVILLIVIGVGIFTLNERVEAPKSNNAPSQEPEVTKNPDPLPFDPTRFSIDDLASIWVVVNKKRPLPKSYEPSDLTAISNEQLRAEAVSALNTLIDSAKKEGHTLNIISGYRSYARQASLYNNYVDRDGIAKADTYSARPGYSEHQTGLAVDLGNGTCDLDECFGETPAGQWLATHAHEYGFIIRYDKNQTNITGYQYEPWHLRYVGKDLSAELHNKKLTMEAFFELSPAPSY